MILLWIILIILGLIIFYFLFTIFCGFIINSKKEYNHNSSFYRFLLNSWTIMALKLLRIKVSVEGLEKLPQDQRFLLVGNHRSNFDPLITWAILRKYDIAFISKSSNFKIPCFGKIIRKCCFLAIDRENPKEALKTITKASELIRNNEVSIGIYPEGTRSKSTQLLPFHNGVFKIAKKAQVPIVVVLLTGTEKIHQTCPWHKSKVTLKIVDVIGLNDINQMTNLEIGENVKQQLEMKKE